MCELLLPLPSQQPQGWKHLKLFSLHFLSHICKAHCGSRARNKAELLSFFLTKKPQTLAAPRRRAASQLTPHVSPLFTSAVLLQLVQAAALPLFSHMTNLLPFQCLEHLSQEQLLRSFLLFAPFSKTCSFTSLADRHPAFLFRISRSTSCCTGNLTFSSKLLSPSIHFGTPPVLRHVFHVLILRESHFFFSSKFLYFLKKSAFAILPAVLFAKSVSFPSKPQANLFRSCVRQFGGALGSCITSILSCSSHCATAATEKSPVPFWRNVWKGHCCCSPRAFNARYLMSTSNSFGPSRY